MANSKKVGRFELDTQVGEGAGMFAEVRQDCHRIVCLHERRVLIKTTMVVTDVVPFSAAIRYRIQL